MVSLWPTGDVFVVVCAGHMPPSPLYTLRMRTLLLALSTILFLPAAVASQGAAQITRVGYAVVTPSIPTVTGMSVFETFVETLPQGTLEVGLFPSDLTMNAVLPVEVSALTSTTLGIAILNPNAGNATVTLMLRRPNGTPLTATTITISGRQQTSKFITELFPAPTGGSFSTQPLIPAEFTGTLAISSNNPLSIVGLKFRGQNFSTIPVTDPSPTDDPIPVILTGVGGLGSVFFPQFVTDGRWATEFVIFNTNSTSLTVRLDVFTQDGAPLPVRLNGQVSSSFTNLVIPGNGLLTLAP